MGQLSEEPRVLHVTDLDGTLLSSAGSLTRFARQTLNELMDDCGLLLTYATARPFARAAEILAGCHFSLPAVVYNGAFTVDVCSGDILASRLMTPTSVREVLDRLQQLRLSPLIYHFDGRDHVNWVSGATSPGIRAYVGERPGDPRFQPRRSWSRLPHDGVFYIVVIEEDRALLESLAATLSADLIGRCHVNVQLDTYHQTLAWLEITAASATKGVGAQEVRAAVGATSLVCFGDNHNDVSLFDVADEAYAVLNAAPAMRRRATAVLGSNDEDAVPRWLAERCATERSFRPIV